jgi:hypothetical protein
MSDITITSENFKRFAKRLQKQQEEQGLKTTLTQAQEILAKTLGANSYFEMNKLFQKENTVKEEFRNSPEDLVTRLFKTSLGQSIPNYKEFNNAQKTLQTAFISERTTNEQLLNNFIRDILDETYTKFSDDGELKKIFEKHVSSEIDAILDKNECNTKNISWWSIVQIMIDLDEPDLARKAQYYAQPALYDLSHVIENSKKLHDLYDNHRMQNSESIISYFQRVISESLKVIYENKIDRTSNGWYNLVSKH